MSLINISDKVQKRFKIASSLSLGIVIFLILVGGVVRSTGSGMGCPDWPKCFGYALPPTEAAQIEFKSGKIFQKGNMVIHNEALWKAKKTFTATDTFAETDWERYTKHDYAVFNPAHTWTEFLNRLVGAITGLVILGMFITALPYRKHQFSVTLFSFLGLILVMVEGWLGKMVVDSNLREGMITIHMIGAMLTLVALITARILAFPVTQKGSAVIQKTRFVAMGVGISVLTLIQIAIGTQVREKVDVVAKTLGEGNRAEWIANLGQTYSIHTSFYLFLMLGIIFWVLQLRKTFAEIPQVRFFSIAMIVLLFTEILAGMTMNSLHIPPILQPVHLLLATLLFGVGYWITMLFITVKTNK